MDGVMFVSDDERVYVDGMRQEDYIIRLFQRLGDAYRKERFVILREEDDGGRVMTHGHGRQTGKTFVADTRNMLTATSGYKC